MTTVCGLEIDASGWLSPVCRVESPNCDERPPDTAISLLVIHAISLPPERFGSDDILRFFTNRLDPNAHPYFAGIHAVRVSSHFLIRRDGALIQFVSCLQRAWHAGESSWQGRPRCNDFSLGIELEGSDTQPFEAAQYTRLAELTARLCKHYPITAIAGHADIAPGRKTDPGPYFDWESLGAGKILERSRLTFSFPTPFPSDPI